MLSAVAARRARLQQKIPARKQSQERPPSPSPPSEPDNESEHAQAKPPSKRKSSVAAPKPSRKKRKVNNPAHKKVSRYFEKDSFKDQEDLIVVEDDDEESDSSDSGESSGEFIPSSSRPSAAARTKRRAWSPSAPLQDSSDEDEINAVPEEALANPAAVAPHLLSTFQPIEGQNFFHITQDELQALGISSSMHAKLLVLRSSERLALLGTYSIVVLQGAVTLNGVRLTACRDAHPIFAPRSSPLPIIEHGIKVGGNCSILSLPTRIAESSVSNDAVILIQELKTGVEGLGRVCRTFEDVFNPSRWQRNQSKVDFGLDGVHYVGLCDFVIHAQS